MLFHPRKSVISCSWLKIQQLLHFNSYFFESFTQSIVYPKWKKNKILIIIIQKKSNCYGMAFFHNPHHWSRASRRGRPAAKTPEYRRDTSMLWRFSKSAKACELKYEIFCFHPKEPLRFPRPPSTQWCWATESKKTLKSLQSPFWMAGKCEKCKCDSRGRSFFYQWTLGFYGSRCDRFRWGAFTSNRNKVFISCHRLRSIKYSEPPQSRAPHKSKRSQWQSPCLSISLVLVPPPHVFVAAYSGGKYSWII